MPAVLARRHSDMGAMMLSASNDCAYIAAKGSNTERNMQDGIWIVWDGQGLEASQRFSNEHMAQLHARKLAAQKPTMTFVVLKATHAYRAKDGKAADFPIDRAARELLKCP